MAKRVRVALLDLPPRLRDIVLDALADAGDIEVVGDPAGLPGIDRRDIDLVIAGTVDGEGRQQIPALLLAAPSVRVLNIMTIGCRAALYQLQPQWIPLGDLSRDGLIEAVRVGPSDTAWRPLPAGTSVPPGEGGFKR